jgi:predicted phosphodiesterase
MPYLFSESDTRILHMKVSAFHYCYLFLVICILGCSKDQENKDVQKTIRFMVVSDIHYFDPSLFSLPSNTYLNSYLDNDRKLILESSAILNALLSIVKTERPDFLIISGDLTKDGEKQDHQILASQLKILTDKGIKVLVIPGNHDIGNSGSYSYLQTNKTRVDNINAADFSTIYTNCGYGDAIDHDTHSLSYVSEPVEGVWILGIDACHYSSVVETAGSIEQGTLDWIKSVIARSGREKKFLIATMHHGMAEHYTGQTSFFPGYVINDWQNISATLADQGLKVVFTGHSHAQDIVRKNSSQGFIFDIETGSTVTYPCPYRLVNLDLGKNQMKIESGNITDVTYTTIPSGTGFQDYAKSFLTSDIKSYVYNKLSIPPYNLSIETIKTLGLDRILANAFLAHTAGDEKPLSTDLADIQILKTLNQSMGETLQNVWNDPAPADNNLLIDLTTGAEIKN